MPLTKFTAAFENQYTCTGLVKSDLIVPTEFVYKYVCSWSYQSRIFVNKDVLHLIQASVYSISSFPFYQRLPNLLKQNNAHESLK